ncbi:MULTISPECIES: dihydrofolate reductase family protein [Micrococcaceae]|uniref:dihydrofolate reductase family protein n=1 Tax=Micrococcaceae TaxID=1268 RepID=UPI001610AA3A|nr:MULTISPECIES: dihydrofolate reductase family protein [Micrococcaceae]MBB5750932.1 dihydrofolate reductase [Micrococcus sp. TA1]HRO30809.1 dihydrofolate reductase family protein [Citricoccus sp.]HRO92388.1 dihydrofolate reductase family protein [Citricoccus sp.]
MRIVITQNMTLDGRIEMLDDWFDPADQDPELVGEMRRQTAGEDVLLLGRQTFEDLRGYWPHRADDTTGVAEALDRADKRVVSATLTDPQWENTTVIGGDPLQAVRELRRQDGRDVVVTGSIHLAHTLIEAALVDEFRMFTHPAWQGRGRSFFPDGFDAPRLRRIDGKVFPHGVVYAAYELAGLAHGDGPGGTALAGLGSEQED